MAEDAESGGVEDIAVQSLLEHVLRRNVRGVKEIGRAGSRDGRL